MYSVKKNIHSKYGNIIEIDIQEHGEFESPFAAVKQAIKYKDVWIKEGSIKVRILIDNQILTILQAKQWAEREYKNLPKCFHCASILKEQVFTHQLSTIELFCSQNCADSSYQLMIDKLDEMEDIEYL